MQSLIIPVESYLKRRHTFAQHMQAGIAIIPTAPERIRNRDAHYPYRFDSYFYYLSGFTEPEAVLVIVAKLIKRLKNIFCSVVLKIRNVKFGTGTAMALKPPKKLFCWMKLTLLIDLTTSSLLYFRINPLSIPCLGMTPLGISASCNG